MGEVNTGRSARKIARVIPLFLAPILLAGCGAVSTPSTSTPARASRFAFVANLLSNSVSTYAVDPETGQLSPKDRAHRRHKSQSHRRGTIRAVYLHRQYYYQ